MRRLYSVSLCVWCDVILLYGSVEMPVTSSYLALMPPRFIQIDCLSKRKKNECMYELKTAADDSRCKVKCCKK